MAAGRFVLVFGVVLATGLLVRRFAFRGLTRWAERTAWKWDDILVSALRKPTGAWIVLIAAYGALGTAEFSARLFRVFNSALLTLLILSILVAATKTTTGIIREYASRVPNFPRTTLITHILNGVIIAIGVLMLLSHFGISITPILTALGVGGLAVALGLQETLSNVFSGLYITVARKVRIGDFVRLESGQEGTVKDIGWRQVSIEELPGNLVIVPNNRFAQAIMTNFSLPGSDTAVLIQGGVAYGSNLEKVEQVTLEVAREVLCSTAGGVADFQPLVRFHTFADSSINFTTVLRARTFPDQHILKHEFIKRIHDRYAREGIKIPFPVRTVHLNRADEKI